MQATADDLTLVIPTIRPRFVLLMRAVRSVSRQTLSPGRLILQYDRERLGAAANRDRGLGRVETEWVAFLDDDDEMLPEHLATLYAAAKTEDADLVYAWFTVQGGVDPFPENFGRPWDPAAPRQTTVTTLGKTASYRAAGGFAAPYSDAEGLARAAQGNVAGEDLRLVLRMNDQRRKIVHVPMRTWIYHHHESNTAGRPDRWRDAVEL